MGDTHHNIQRGRHWLILLSLLLPSASGVGIAWFGVDLVAQGQEGFGFILVAIGSLAIFYCRGVASALETDRRGCEPVWGMKRVMGWN